jgi:hypothetical protein
MLFSLFGSAVFWLAKTAIAIAVIYNGYYSLRKVIRSVKRHSLFLNRSFI